MIPSAVYDFIGQHGGPIGPWQMSLRAIAVFFIGLVYVRMAGKRVFGKWGSLDILLAVIIGSNLSRTITGSAPFGPTLIATAVLIALHTALIYMIVHIPALGGWLKGRPTQLIADGQVDWSRMRREGLGEGDLAQALRTAGLTDPAQAQAAYLERNGNISVILARRDHD